jgi:hypothetical protein
MVSMMRGATLGAVALATLGTTVQAQAAERLVSPALAGYVLGYQASNDTQSIREEVPSGETVERWTRMVTTQRFAGLAKRTTPAAYAKTIASQLPAACPGAAISPIANIAVSRHPAVQLQVDCPRNENGQRETFLMIAIAGENDMHVKQVAFRGARSPTDLAWARSFLAKTTLISRPD